jgi:hypothetical protein
MLLPSTWQYASAFNQPLSFDTSKVTNMINMFWVRPARALAPQVLSRTFFVHAASAAATPCPPPPGLAPRPISHAPPLTRQNAHAFNQPLSFDTSKVTVMTFMFFVRPARALSWPPKPWVGPSPCTPA